MLVIIGADEYGEKDVLAIMDGFRGKRGQLARPSEMPEETRPGGAAGVSHWRRCARVLDGAARCLPRDARTAMLGSQDRQRHRRDAQVPERKGQGRSAGHLDG